MFKYSRFRKAVKRELTKLGHDISDDRIKLDKFHLDILFENNITASETAHYISAGFYVPRNMATLSSIGITGFDADNYSYNPPLCNHEGMLLMKSSGLDSEFVKNASTACFNHTGTYPDRDSLIQLKPMDDDTLDRLLPYFGTVSEAIEAHDVGIRTEADIISLENFSKNPGYSLEIGRYLNRASFGPLALNKISPTGKIKELDHIVSALMLTKKLDKETLRDFRPRAYGDDASVNDIAFFVSRKKSGPEGKNYLSLPDVKIAEDSLIYIESEIEGEFAAAMAKDVGMDRRGIFTLHKYGIWPELARFAKSEIIKGTEGAEVTAQDILKFYHIERKQASENDAWGETAEWDNGPDEERTVPLPRIVVDDPETKGGENLDELFSPILSNSGTKSPVAKSRVHVRDMFQEINDGYKEDSGADEEIPLFTEIIED